MRKSWLTLLVIGALSAFSSASYAQVSTGSIPSTDHGPYNLAEAYPCVANAFMTGSEAASITPLQVFNGTGTNCAVASNNTTATTPAPLPGASPGILALLRATDASGNLTQTLNANCFVVIPSGQTGPCFVQAFRLIKQVPGSFKCPDVFGLPHFDSNGNLIPFQFFQFGSGVRTWWSLNFTQPGTQFILEVVSVCRTVPGLTPVLHKDRWIWRVVANVDTLGILIELLHTGAVGTLEVPCILGEDMYDALKKAQQRLAGAVAETSASRLTDLGNAIFDMEALVVANCLFVELLNPLVAFPGPSQFGVPNIQPPGNQAQTITFDGQGSAVAGIIDTIEHPCCCKLLVDLEWITISQGLAGTSPTLPTF